jgi:hypothetical protein
VIPTELPCEQIWLHDFEFVPEPGERPDVVCLVAHELRSGRRISLWRDALHSDPPYPTGRNTLFVSFVANAECACHLALGWPLPANVLDLSPAFRNLTNGQFTPEGKGLLGALRYYGLDTIGAKQKDAMQKRIMKGWPFTPEERQQILTYCGSDVDALRRLLSRMLPEIDLDVALYHGEFAAVSALMEHHGVPIDLEVFSQLADEVTWRALRDAMVPAIDARYGVYVRNAAGDWTFNMERFVAYLEREGIIWPRLETGKLNMRRKTFDEMSKCFPQLEDLRQLRYVRNKMRKVKLAVGRDARNRTVLWPCKAKTSRTQPKASQWIFSPAVWLRSLIKPEPGNAVAYIDWSAMEFLIAASLSDGHCGPVNNMLDMYLTGDPYLTFAKRVGGCRPLPQRYHTPRYAIATRTCCWLHSTGCHPKLWQLVSVYRRSKRAKCSTNIGSFSLNTGNGPTIGSPMPCKQGLCGPHSAGLAELVSWSSTSGRSATGRFRPQAPTF